MRHIYIKETRVISKIASHHPEVKSVFFTGALAPTPTSTEMVCRLTVALENGTETYFERQSDKVTPNTATELLQEADDYINTL